MARALRPGAERDLTRSTRSMPSSPSAARDPIAPAPAPPAAGTTALTRPVSRSISRCELTHLAREPIDYDAAAREHDLYERALEELGCAVRRLPAAHDRPDAVFVEDAAVVLDEVAVLARPGAPSRRGEVSSVAEALAPLREIVRIEAPGTLDGGDVLVLGRTVYVGRSERTDDAGIEQMGRLLADAGYSVRAVPVRGCLHLKTAVTALSGDLLLLNPDWVPADAFAGVRLLEVDPAEPFAANALRLGDTLIHAAEHRATRRRIEAAGLRVYPVEMRELAKAEAGVTCCSLVLGGAGEGGTEAGVTP